MRDIGGHGLMLGRCYYFGVTNGHIVHDKGHRCFATTEGAITNAHAIARERNAPAVGTVSVLAIHGDGSGRCIDPCNCFEPGPSSQATAQLPSIW
jgi:hypothetical protein